MARSVVPIPQDDLAPAPVKVARALLSVSDKSGLVAFAQTLSGFGVELISTGGTAAVLREAGLEVISIDEVTGFPEMMNGRLKTLHPKIHGGLLALRDNDDHVASMEAHDIQPIDMVVVNLYPFEATVAREDVTEAEAIEQIDIGGPSMVRSAAKNHRHVTIVTNPSQYDQVVEELNAHNGATMLPLRRTLCNAAFALTGAYDAAIAAWLAESDEPMPPTRVIPLERAAVLRYGENPHQAGALYLESGGGSEPTVATAEQLHGKALSFNNLYDANGALELVKEFDATHSAAAVIKHANPCGLGIGSTAAEAFVRAYEGDPVAAFGGIVAMNVRIDADAATQIVDGKKFLEVIVAPDFDADALEILQDRWANVRLLKTGSLPHPNDRNPADLDIKRITGGLLIQERDLAPFNPKTWSHVAGPEPSETMLRQMHLAMVAVKHLKSNAVCLVNEDRLIGAGAGQMDRLASCSIAIEKAGERAKGAVAGSDAFFPFRDGPDRLIAAGVGGIAQPGGSKRDEETIAACDESDVTLVFTGRRHFRH
jgi:phosphoribosylaminoimidazolecarboxamide formyltransferase/IMP cyclohydrolase